MDRFTLIALPDGPASAESAIVPILVEVQLRHAYQARSSNHHLFSFASDLIALQQGRRPEASLRLFRPLIDCYWDYTLTAKPETGTDLVTIAVFGKYSSGFSGRGSLHFGDKEPSASPETHEAVTRSKECLLGLGSRLLDWLASPIESFEFEAPANA